MGEFTLLCRLSTTSQQQAQEILWTQQCNHMIQNIRKIMVTDFNNNYRLNKDGVAITERKQATLVTSLRIQMRKK